MNKCLTFCFYPLFFILVCFLLPDDILDKSSALNDFVAFFKGYINTLNNFELNARYPGVFQIAFLLSLFLMPIQCIFADQSGYIKDAKDKVGDIRLLFLAAAILLVILFYILYWYGGHVGDVGKFEKNMKSVMSSKLYFSLFSSLWLVCLSFMLVTFYYHVRYFFTRSV